MELILKVFIMVSSIGILMFQCYHNGRKDLFVDRVQKLKARQKRRLLARLAGSKEL